MPLRETCNEFPNKGRTMIDNFFGGTYEDLLKGAEVNETIEEEMTEGEVYTRNMLEVVNYYYSKSHHETPIAAIPDLTDSEYFTLVSLGILSIENFDLAMEEGTLMKLLDRFCEEPDEGSEIAEEIRFKKKGFVAKLN